MIYDIRSTACAQQTLTNLTGVPISVWEQYLGRESEYEHPEGLVADVIKSHGFLPSNYKDFEFVYFHVTTSANGCAAFRKHGILDLKQSYLCGDSEVRAFLDQQNIHIDLNERMLIYQGESFDISFGACPRRNAEGYYRWAVGRKFYYDYTTCGFLSVREKVPYGGQVHRRPEIINNIDNLLRLNLSKEWIKTHNPYKIVAKVSGEKIVYDDNGNNQDMVLNFLTSAYFTAFEEPSERVLLIKNNIQIPPSDILEIRPLEHWQNG